MNKMIPVLLVMMMSLSGLAFASDQPMDALQKPIDEVISILKDPQYQDAEQKKVQGEKIWNIIQKVFDFDRIAKLALGKYRKNFSDEQLKTFSGHFARLIEDTYLNKIQAEYKNEKVNYLEQKIREDKALVKTEVVRENVRIPVDYLMQSENDLWRVYDVKVEKVSLVKNYRSQFERVLGDESKTPDQLIEQVREKLEKQKKGKNGANK